MGLGTVNYRRMLHSDFTKVEAYSVQLDRKIGDPNNPFYYGTLFFVKDVREPNPFPMPGTVWIFEGNDQCPWVGPKRVLSLRWFRGQAEVLFDDEASYACIEHIMTMNEWKCIENPI